VETFDAIILGGGPAGSTVAWQLVRAGLDVMVLDKKTFPRDKVCAGWVTPAVMSELEVDLDDYGLANVLQPIRAFRTGTLGGSLVENRYDEIASYGIRRVEFDDYLLGRSGAQLRLGEALKSIARHGDHWLLNGHYETPVLIGAGGHFCPVARELGAKLGATEQIVAAHEIEFEMTPEQVGACAVDGETPELFFCPDLSGYGWVFRKGNVLNIGLGRDDNHGIAKHVDAFCDYLKSLGRIPPDIPTRFKGHAYILYGHSKRDFIDDNALLVGDAIGLAYTQSGEGIRPAVESALLAVTALTNADGNYSKSRLGSYATALEQRLGVRGAQSQSKSWIPARVREAIAGHLLGNRWFSRHYLLDDWFLHRKLAPLQPPYAAK
jgi:flavin-dependent dehydrogenase